MRYKLSGNVIIGEFKPEMAVVPVDFVGRVDCAGLTGAPSFRPDVRASPHVHRFVTDCNGAAGRIATHLIAPSLRSAILMVGHWGKTRISACYVSLGPPGTLMPVLT